MQVHYNKDSLLWRYDKRRVYPSGVYKTGHGNSVAEVAINDKAFKDTNNIIGLNNYQPLFFNIIYPGPVFDHCVLNKHFVTVAGAPAEGDMDYEIYLVAEDKSVFVGLLSDSISAGDHVTHREYENTPYIQLANSLLASGKRLWFGVFTIPTSFPFNPEGLLIKTGFTYTKL